MMKRVILESPPLYSLLWKDKAQRGRTEQESNVSPNPNCFIFPTLFNVDTSQVYRQIDRFLCHPSLCVSQNDMLTQVFEFTDMLLKRIYPLPSIPLPSVIQTLANTSRSSREHIMYLMMNWNNSTRRMRPRGTTS